MTLTFQHRDVQGSWSVKNCIGHEEVQCPCVSLAFLIFTISFSPTAYLILNGMSPTDSITYKLEKQRPCLRSTNERTNISISINVSTNEPMLCLAKKFIERDNFYLIFMTLYLSYIYYVLMLKWNLHTD